MEADILPKRWNLYIKDTTSYPSGLKSSWTPFGEIWILRNKPLGIYRIKKYSFVISDNRLHFKINMTVVTDERQILISEPRRVPGWWVLKRSENRGKFPWTFFFKMFRQFSVLHEKISLGKSQISELLSPYFMGLVFNEILLLRNELTGMNKPFLLSRHITTRTTRLAFGSNVYVLLCLIQFPMKP